MGLIHLISAITSLISGTMVLALKKGTSIHKKIGYTYIVSMVISLTSSFMIYRLFGGFGVFHIASILSSITLVLGVIPAIRRKPHNGWRFQHLSFMYWSIIGLYAAFASEVLTRVPETPFFGMVGIASALVIITGAVFFKRIAKIW